MSTVRLLSVQDMRALIHNVGILEFYRQLIDQLEDDFRQWNSFRKQPRIAEHYPDGVIELMPISNDHAYAFKYVNGHPINPTRGKPTVFAIGLLAEVSTGIPRLITEMTVLTALRTAATSALAGLHLARKNAQTHAIIGTGAQSEYQALAFQQVWPELKIRCYDLDTAAMEKFCNNLAPFKLHITQCASLTEAIEGADIITTATAKKSQQQVLVDSQVQAGVHINAIGGDCPGKTELDPEILKRSKVVVELTEQTLIEGEIQDLGESAVHAELWEIISQRKPGRLSPSDITLFDSVGFALEDYSTLVLVDKLARQHNVGMDIDMVPDLADPKDLYGILN